MTITAGGRCRTYEIVDGRTTSHTNTHLALAPQTTDISLKKTLTNLVDTNSLIVVACYKVTVVHVGIHEVRIRLTSAIYLTWRQPRAGLDPVHSYVSLRFGRC